MARTKRSKYTNAVLDFETDPFKFGRVPKPFAAEFHCDLKTEVFWGDNCVERLMEFLEAEETPYRIYAHNGGKFDFHFMHKYLDNPLKVINSRIVHATLGKHVVRDSLAIIPVPLKRFFKSAKGEIDYRRLERHLREKHKTEILEYLHQDCTSLYATVSAFDERFGPKLTVGSTAMEQLIQLHDFEIMSPEQDAIFRPFYFGGRVECFKSGILEGPYIGIDVNSSYPKSMRDFKHPLSAAFHEREKMPDNFDIPFFVEFDGTNQGALPIIDDTGGLVFDKTSGRFRACSHELKVAFEYGLATVDKVHKVYIAQQWGSFGDFVDKFYAEKVAAKMTGDELTEMFSKFMLNSCYGKFGTNPDNFQDWYINRDFGNDLTLEANGYTLECEYDDFELWARPSEINKSAYFNVSIAASITSASRSILLDGLQRSVNPVYCDTDSIICKGFNGEISDSVLGAWKLERTAPSVAIAGKKLYAMYDPETLALPKTVYNKEFQAQDPNPARKAMKLSSKGGQLSVDDIIAICKGQTVRYENMAPSFSIHKDTKFIARNFKMTAHDTIDEIAEFS